MSCLEIWGKCCLDGILFLLDVFEILVVELIEGLMKWLLVDVVSEDMCVVVVCMIK